MRRARHWIHKLTRHDRFEAVGAEDGSASLEFITAGLVLLVPLVYLVLAVASIQATALGAEGAARHAARVYAQAPDESQASERALRAIAVGLSDYGYDVSDAEVEVTCRPDPAHCLIPGSIITVAVHTRAPLPLVPDLLDMSHAASIPISGVASQKVSRFWGAS